MPLRTPPPFTLSLLCRAALAAAAPLLAASALAQVQVKAPDPLDDFLKRHLQAPSSDARGAALEAFARSARGTAAELLATEGYFSPDIQVEADPGRLSVAVAPGPRTRISEVSIEIRGDISPERRRELEAAWPLKRGEAFRDPEWSEGKQILLRRLLDKDFPGARLADSRAEIHPESATARLSVVYDTGPRYIFNGLDITGLNRYSPELVKRYSKIEPGQPYDQDKLLALQTALQRTPYFGSVSVEIDRPDNPPETGPVTVPVHVHVQERAPHRISLGAGVSTNTGAQVEAIYQGYDFLHRAWQLDAGVRLEQLRQRLYANVRLPPDGNQRDSFGTLADWEDIQGLQRRRIALGAVRTEVRGSVETRYATNWQQERREPQGGQASTNTALTLDGSWILRRVDNLLDPRRGFIAQVQAGGGAKALLSDQNFLRLHGRYQHFFPVGQRDVLSLRGELGATLAPSREGIPQDFLFRTGGAQSVRGYGYQSIGIQEGSAIVGGRYLAVASAEYTHWFNEKWGGAVFVDAGDVADRRSTLDLAVGYGVGARWKSPAGPLAVDLAYGARDEKLRLHFSLAIAF